jgi:hypothetical protein
MIAVRDDLKSWRNEVTVLCRLLDRTPSERSEASWSF